MKTQKMLSKSKIKSILRCNLQGWNDIHGVEKVWDEQTKQRFEMGRVVEQIGRDLFVGGVLMDKIANADKIVRTQELLADPSVTVIFEATFLSQNTIIMFDVLIKQADGTFHAVEIKSTTKMEEEFDIDTTIQYWIARANGIIVSKYDVWVINTQAVATDYSDYFTSTEVTDVVSGNEENFKTWIKLATEILEMETAPTHLLGKDYEDALALDATANIVKIGKNCEDCPFAHICMKGIGETADSVFSLARFTKKWEAADKGILSVNDPRFAVEYKKYYDSHPIMMQSIKENRLVIDQAGVDAALAKYSYPLFSFDFETLQSPVPLLAKQRPYQQVVVQFSAHVLRNPNDKKAEHFEYLHTDTSCPDLNAIEAMLSVLGETGSIMAWNKSFEQTQIRALAKSYPEYATRLLALVERFVDLMEVVRDFCYDPRFMGSFSLKKVSPAFLKEFGSYTDSEIKNGGEIAKYFTEMVTTTDMARKAVIHAALLRYCKYDSVNVLFLLAFLKDQTANIQELMEINILAA